MKSNKSTEIKKYIESQRASNGKFSDKAQSNIINKSIELDIDPLRFQEIFDELNLEYQKEQKILRLNHNQHQVKSEIQLSLESNKKSTENNQQQQNHKDPSKKKSLKKLKMIIVCLVAIRFFFFV